MQDRWIWPFELEEKIGDGGMGVVYRARYVKDDRKFAVKLLPLDLADQTILARFEREMEVMKTLKHSNIVRCFGGVCGDKKRFYAMELVEGGTLAEIIHERTKLPWEEAIEYGLQICRALAYAHSKGVVHRDVKPSNFLVTNTGKLKLSDFGLISVAADSRLTAAGKTMGTIPYMAPEQIRGTPPPSPQTDLYSLGVVMFEMLTGQPPFRGNTAAETMHQHLNNTPPQVRRYVRECPRALENLINKMLEKEPADRPTDAMAVARQLEDIWQTAALGDETIDARAVDDTPGLRAPAVVPRPKAAAPAKIPTWLLTVGLAVVGVMFVWNLVLLGQVHSPTLAEKRWFDAMSSDESQVRLAAAKALGEIGAEPKRSVAELTRGLSDANSEVRRASISSLKKLGDEARPSVNMLKKLQNTDADTQVREEAQAAIAAIGQGGAGSLWLIYAALGFVVAALCVIGYLAARRHAPR